MTKHRPFIDSWGWGAMTVADDPDHDRARTLHRSLLSHGRKPVTSRFVIAETLTRLRYDASHNAALALADRLDSMVEAGLIEVITVDDELGEAAIALFRRYDDQRFSIVDCTSFAIMHDRGINDALTADQHFAVDGFVPLGV